MTQADFPVTWDDPADAERTWFFGAAGTPDTLSPLGFDLYMGPFIKGFGPARARYVNYYAFYFAVMLPKNRPLITLERLARALRRWNDSVVPEVIAAADRFLTTDFDAMSNEQLADEIAAMPAWRKHLGRLHELAFVPYADAVALLFATYRELVEDNELAALRLVQGYGNKSVDAGHALWRVSQIAASIPAVHDRVLRDEPAQDSLAALEAEPEARPFLDAFSAFLDEFGWRADLFEIAQPTWFEDPSIPLAQLRAYLHLPDYDPAAELERQASARDQVIAETMARLTPDGQQRLRAVLDVVKDAVRLQEDHNYYIDQRCGYAPRRLILAAGRRFFDDSADVFMLHAGELIAALRGEAIDAREIASERKLEMARWAKIKPPAWIGAPPTEEQAAQRSHFDRAGASPNELRGNGVSGGVARGPARVLLSLSEADRLQPGEVLVARTTMPAWTPLFAVASALVTEVGGMLSHPAVTAREYGLPAVLNVADATKRIRDGQLVEVDGTNGVVRLMS
jgi:pyruvate,water dikinase